MTTHRLQLRRAGQKKRTKTASLNLVSLMDIFTILVFFLMVNSSEVEVLQSNSDIKLPDSSSEQRPENQLMISVSQQDIIVMGRPVADVATIRGSKDLMIEGLKTELEYQRDRKGDVPEGGFEVTLMGDRELPYWLLKKIMLTCQATDFARISLAVNKLEEAQPGVEAAEDVAASSANLVGGAPS